MELVFLNSRCQGKILQHEGYLFRINKRTPDRLYWQCMTFHCKAKVVLDPEEKKILGTSGSHSHAANPAEIEVRWFYEMIRKNALNDPDATGPEIYRKSLSQIDASAEFFPQIPNFDGIKHFIYNIRNAARGNSPKTNKKLESDGIPKTTSVGETFLKTDARKSEKRVLEENNYLLSNENSDQIDCAIDYSRSQSMKENICQDVQASATSSNLQVQNRIQYLPDKQKFTSNYNAPEHIERSVDFHLSQFSVDVEENQCQDGQVTNALKNLETHMKQFLPDENFIESENSHENSVVYHPNLLVEQNNENNCQVLQVIDKHMNVHKNSIVCYPNQLVEKGSANNCQVVQVNDKHVNVHKNSVVYHPNQLVEQNNVSNCQVLQVIDKHMNVNKNSAVYPPNQLIEQNNENNCPVVKVIDKHMNANKKRKLNSPEEQVEETCSVLRPDTVRKDEFHVFGDYLASELRKLSPRALALAKHNINNILFEANIGIYDSPSTSNS